MQLWIPTLLVACVVSHAFSQDIPANPKCSDAQTCSTGGGTPSRDKSTAENCRILKVKLDCITAAVDDCVNNGGLPESTMDIFKQSMSYAEKAYDDACDACAIKVSVFVICLGLMASFFMGRRE